jgi:hypothetical protein
VIQSAPLFALHAHSRSVVICSVPLPPFASIVAGLPVAVNAQRASLLGAVTLVDDDEQLLETRSATAVNERERVDTTER